MLLKYWTYVLAFRSTVNCHSWPFWSLKSLKNYPQVIIQNYSRLANFWYKITCDLIIQNIPQFEFSRQNFFLLHFRPLGFDEFQTLSSTKQNIELFKILNAIAEEIEVLRQSTEHRFSALETMLQYNKGYLGLLPVQDKNSGKKEESSVDSRNNPAGSDRSSGTTTRPASWPKDQREDSVDLMLAKNLAEDRPVWLNVGGKKFEVRILTSHC